MAFSVKRKASKEGLAPLKKARVDVEHTRLLQLEDIREERQLPFQSRFRVVAGILYENPRSSSSEQKLNFEVGANTECCWIGAGVCAERSSITQIYAKLRHHEFKIKAVYLVSDLDTPLLPGVACREWISDYCDASCMVISKGKNGDIVRMKFSDLYPYPYLYEKKTQSEINAMRWTTISSFPSVKSEWVDLYNETKSKAISDEKEWHFNKIAAGVRFSDGTTITSPQYSVLEYTNSMDALSSLFCQIRYHTEKTPEIVVMVDKFGVCHPPFSQARALYVEYGMGNLCVIHHTSTAQVAITAFQDFYPHCPVWKCEPCT